MKKKKNQLCFLIVNKTVWKHHNEIKRNKAKSNDRSNKQQEKKNGRQTARRAEAEMEEKMLQHAGREESCGNMQTVWKDKKFFYS